VNFVLRQTLALNFFGQGQTSKAKATVPRPRPAYCKAKATVPRPRPAYCKAKATVPRPRPAYCKAKKIWPSPRTNITCCCGKQDSFVVRTYDVFSVTPSSVVHELPLKLARKCLDVFGHSASADQAEGAVTALSG